MTLADLENEVLSQLQQPGSNFPSAPTWSALNNPQYAQGIIDHYINRAYAQLMSDIAEWEIFLTRAIFPSIAQQGYYPLAPLATNTVNTTIPGAVNPGQQVVITPAAFGSIALGQGLVIDPGLPTQELLAVSAVSNPTFTAFQVNLPHAAGAVLRGAKYPAVRQVRRAYYGPQGLLYSQEYIPGGDLISWREFQRYTDKGFLTPFSFATQPGKAAVTPNRQFLAWYSLPAAAGDAITVDYAPLPTANADFCPTLVNETDVPVLPDDWHDLIVVRALPPLWMRERQAGAATAHLQMYRAMLADKRDQYAKNSSGDGWAFQQKYAGTGVLGSIGGLAGSGVQW